MRQDLTSNLNLFVATTGSDTNTGLSAGSPFKTPQKAYDLAQRDYDFRGQYGLVVKLADGAYTDGLIASGPLVGQRSAVDCIIRGNLSTAGAVSISVSTGRAIHATNHAIIQIEGMDLSAQQAALGCCVLADNGAIAVVGTNVRYGPAGHAHIYSLTHGHVALPIGYTITGDAPIHWLTEDTGLIAAVGINVALSGTRNFSNAFALAGFNSVQDVQTTFTGSATGVKYKMLSGGKIVPTGGLMQNLDNLPGSLPGQNSDNVASFSASLGGASQTGVGDFIYTKVNHTAPVNPSGWFDNANHRWNPKQKGSYLVLAAVQFLNLADGNMVRSCVYKNGAEAAYNITFPGAAGSPSGFVAAKIEMNGSTDYLEHFVLHSGTGSNKDIFGVPTATYFQASYAGDWNL